MRSTDVAQTRAKELEISYSHTRPNGDPGYWENINKGYVSSQLAQFPDGHIEKLRSAGTPSSVVSSWMMSSGHYENMMKYEVDDAGNVIGAKSMAVGCYIGDDGFMYWVIVFDSSDTDVEAGVMTNPLL